MVSIAIPTGVLLEGARGLLDSSGLAELGEEELGRQLLVERGRVRVIIVRPADVPAYVDHGAADLGIVGKDILWETPGSHYELVDLRFGGCRLVLAVPNASALDGPRTWPPLTISGDSDRNRRRFMGDRSMRGTYGDGSAVLTIRTFSGDIVISGK